MKSRIPRWLVCLLGTASLLCAAPVDDRIAEGRAALAVQNLSLARAKFAEARAADRGNETAAALLGLTRWFALVGDAPAQAVMSGAGISAQGRDVYSWSAKFPEDAQGDAVLPAGYNFESQREFWRDTIVPTATAVRADLAAVTADDFVLTLSPAETDSSSEITIDRADLLTIQAGLRAFEMFAQLALGQNWNGDYARMLRLLQADTLTFRQAMEENTDLMKAGPLEHRLAAKAALLDFVNLYRRASSAIRARPPGLDRLFMLETPQDFSDEADFRRYLAEFEKSATDYVQLPDGTTHVSFAPLATAGWSLRGSLPPMTAGRFDPGAISDASLGGVVLGLRREYFAMQLVEAGYTADLGWTVVNPTPLASNLQKYAHTGTYHLVTGTNGTIGRSADGVTWNYQQLPNAQDFFNIAANGGGVVVAVGNTQIWRSADHGATWRHVHTTWRRSAPEGEGGLFGLVWDGGRFVALTSGGIVWTSPDGVAWTRGKRIAPASVSLGVNGLDYAAGRFVATGAATVNGASRAVIFTSTDGGNWALSFTGAGAGSYRTAVFAQGRWVAGASNGRIATSLDGGVTWSETAAPAGTTPDNFSGSAVGGGQFVLAGNRVATSTDGVTWSYVATPESLVFNDAVAGPGGVFLPGAQGALYRFDGTTFARLDANTSILPRFGASLGKATVFNGKRFIAGPAGAVYESADGQTFTARQTSTSNALTSLAVHNGQLFAGGAAGTVVSSADGVTWQTRISGDATLTTNSINDLASLNGQLLALAGSNLVLTSPDGLSWARRTIPGIFGGAASSTFGAGYYLVASGGVSSSGGGVWENAIAYSSDAITWTRLVIRHQFETINGTGVRQALFDGERFVLYLGNGEVLRANSANPADGFSVITDGLGRLASGANLDRALVATSFRVNDELRAGFLYSFDGEDWVRTELPTSEASTTPPHIVNDRVHLNGASVIARSNRPWARPAPSAGAPVIIPARVGQSVTLGAPITASEDLAYQWSFNGTDIVGATSSSLTLSQMTGAQAGTYTVTATGRRSGQSATNTVTVLIVPGAPTITQQPAGGLAPAGGSFTFSVTAAGGAPLAYQWFRDNQPVAGATSATLPLTDLSSANAGRYRVEVSNAGGVATSSDARLEVSASGVPPGFWDDSEWNHSPSRLVSDGQGRFYATWNVWWRAQDVVGGINAGSLVRFSEATGAIDPSFVWNERLGSPLFVCVQPDGKLLVATNHLFGEGSTVVRVNADGSLDTSFSAPRFNRSIRFMTLQSDGKLLVGATDGAPAVTLPGMLVAIDPTVYRLQPTGALDSTFTPAVLNNFGVLFAPPVVDSQGKIYLLGSFSGVNGTTRRGVARLSSAGVLDGFADPVTLPTGWLSNTIGRGLFFQSDGRPVLVGRFGYTARGSSTNPILAVRFNTDDTFDATFGQPLRSQTPVNTSVGIYARWVQPAPNGGFYLTMDRILRFTAEGTLDPAWPLATAGYDKEIFWLMTSPTTGNLYAPDMNVPGNIVALTPSGGTVVGFDAGGFGTTTTPESAIVLADGRLLAAGNYDHFGGTDQPGSSLFGANGLLAGDATAFHDAGVRFINPYARAFQWPDRSFGVLRMEQGDPFTGEGGDFSPEVRRFNSDGTPRNDWELDFSPVAAWNFTPKADGGLILWRDTPDFAELLATNGRPWIRYHDPKGALVQGPFGDFASLGVVDRSNPSNPIIEHGEIADLQLLGDGAFLALVAGRDGTVALRKYRADGVADSTYVSVALGDTTIETGFTSSMLDPTTGFTRQFETRAHLARSYFFRSLPDGSAYVSGRLKIAGVERNLVKLAASGALDATVPDLTLGYNGLSGLPARVAGIGLDESGRLYIAGRFDTANGVNASGLVRLTPQGILDTTWSAGVSIVEPLGGDPDQEKVLFAAGRGWLHIMGPVKGAGDLRSTGYKRIAVAPTTPTIVAQSGNVTVAAGQSLQLFAGVFGGGDMTYTWTRNGTLLNAPNLPFLDLGTATIGSAGTYVLTATNSQSTVQSAAMVVSVSPLPGIIAPPRSTTVVEGGNSSLSVTAVSATPLTYQWRRNGTPIPGATAATLSLSAVTQAQAGDYTVTVTNLNGGVTSAAASLTVVAGPAGAVFTAQPATQTLQVGYTAVLTAAVTPPAGATVTSYRWFRDGALWSTQNTSATSATLQVSAPAAGTSNAYHVVVTTSNGGTATSATATIAASSTSFGFSTIAGLNSRGSTDGLLSAARFNFPNGIAFDSAGNAYVVDSNNATLRRISPSGIVSTHVGVAGSFGNTDGPLPSARLNGAQGVVVAPNGDIFILQTTMIRKVSGGAVSTLAGSTTGGALDGSGTSARFSNLSRGALDSAGNLYVSDSTAIRKVTPAGVVTTFAGTLGTFGYADGALGMGRVSSPRGLVVLADGSVVFVDTNNSALRKADPSGNLSTLAGAPPPTSQFAHLDGVGTAARFSNPQELVLAPNGDLYVIGSGTVRRVDSTLGVTTIAGQPFTSGSTDGSGGAARFWSPLGAAWDAANGRLLVTDASNNNLRLVTTTGVVTTLTGVAPGAADGTGATARFNAPENLVIDANGDLIVSDSNNRTLRKVSPTGVTSTFSGVASPASSSFVDGAATMARYGNPRGLARHPSTGEIFVFDSGRIRKVASDGSVSTFVGPTDNSFFTGSADGIGNAARFSNSGYLAFAPNGDLYVADTNNSTIRKVTPDGTVTTLAGVAGSSGAVDGSVAGGAATSAVRFSFPRGIAADANGNLFVVQSSAVRKIDSAGNVTTFAGASSSSQLDGMPPSARLGFLQSITLAPDGQLYVGSSGGIQRISPQTGLVTTLAGNPLSSGFADASGTAARADGISGLAVDATGTIYFADLQNGVIRRTISAAALSFTSTPFSQTVTAGANISFTATATGATGITYRWQRNGVDLADGGNVSGSGTATLTLTGVTLADAGSYAVRAAAGAASAVSGTAILTVNGPPTPPAPAAFTAQPASQTVFSGNSFALAGTVTPPSGATVTGYRWFLNGALFSTQNVTASTTSLNFGAQAAGTISTYHVVATFSDGSSVTSAPATISVSPASYSFSSVAGNNVRGSADGTLADARFSFPNGMAADAAGNVYVADSNSHTVRRIARDGTVTTPVGAPGFFGFTDGSLAVARLGNPAGVVAAPNGDIFVLQPTAIRKVAGGVVSTLAGSSASGTIDGLGAAARFNGLTRGVLDSAGNLLVADGTAIRKVAPDGTVTTFAGTLGTSGYADGAPGVGRVNSPRGLAWLPDGSLLFVDSGNSALRKADAAGNLTTVAGSPPPSASSTYLDGLGTAARFANPQDLVVTPAGEIYVLDNSNTVRRVDAAFNVTTVAGVAFNYGFNDGTGAAARFAGLRGAVWDAAATRLLVTDGSTLRAITPAGTVATIAGMSPGSQDGTGTAARFNQPDGVVLDQNGNLIVSDTSNRTLRKITPAGVVTTLAGVATPVTAPVSYVDGSPSVARLMSPRGLAVHPSTGEIYVFDSGRIRKVAADGAISTFVGPNDTATMILTGSADGVGNAARFSSSGYLAFSPTGDLFVADQFNHTIRKVTPDGTVTTIAGVANSLGSTDGSLAGGATTSPVRFSNPRGIAIDGAGNLYVAQNSMVRKIDAGGMVTTLVGAPNFGGQLDGLPPLARLGFLNCIAIGPDGQLYVGSQGGIQRVHPQTGQVTTLVGNLFTSGFADGAGTSARADFVSGLAVAADGTIYFTDMNNGVIRRASGPGALTFSTHPLSQSVGAGSTFTLSAAAVPSAGVAYRWMRNGVELADGGGVSGSGTASLSISNVGFSDGGNFVLRATAGSTVAYSNGSVVTVTTGAASDNFAGAAPITGLSGTVTGNNLSATGELGEPVHFSSQSSASSIWYAYRPLATGVATFDTFGSNFDTVLAAYNGSSLANLAFLAQNNDANGTAQSRLVLPVSAGTTYYLAVASNATTRGSITLNHSLLVTPQPAALALAPGQAGTLSITPDPSANPAVSVQWRRDGVDLPGATQATLTNISTPGVYQVGIAQGGPLSYSRSAATAVLVAPTGGGVENESFSGTALSAAWNGTQSSSLPESATAFTVNERVEFSVPNITAGAFRQVDRTDVFPLDRGWSVVLRAVIDPSALPTMQGSGSAREIGLGLIATHSANAGSFHRLTFRYRNDSGTPRFERLMQTTTNGAAGSALGLATLSDANVLLRFDYDPAGLLTSSISSGGSSFVSVGSINVLSSWGLARTGSLRVGLRAHADLVAVPTGAVWVDDGAGISHPMPGPVIQTQPTGATIGEGGSRSLNVVLSPNTAGTPTFQWFKDGVAIPNARSQSYFAREAGSYTVAVTLNGITVTSQAAVITLTPSAPVGVTVSTAFGAAGMVVPAGTNTYLLASLSAGSAPVSYQWFKGGVAIPGATASTYPMPEAQADQQGAYSVVASNSLGSGTSPESRFWITPEGGWRWRHPMPTGNGTTRVAFVNGQFFMGGLRGTLLVSSDGLNWATRQVPVMNNLSRIEFVQGQYVMLGSLNSIFTSSDGVVWTPRSTGVDPGTKTINELVAGNGRLLALGGPGLAAVSTDLGATWTLGDLGSSGVTDSIFGAIFALNRFIAVSGPTGRVFSSSDGVTWSVVSTPATALSGIAYGAGRLVAVGGIGTAGAIVTSTDGTNWTIAPTGTSAQFRKVEFLNGRFIAVGGAGAIFTSPDGLAWTPRNSPDTTLGLQSTAYGNGRYVIASQSNRGILTSTDAENWSLLTSSSTQASLVGVASSSSTVVALGNGGVILRSSDKATWTSRPSGTANGLTDVAYAQGKFVAVGSFGTVLSSVDEGSSWALQPPSNVISSNSIQGVRFSPLANLWIAVAGGGAIYTAPDGATFTWTSRNPATTAGFRKVAVGANLHVAVGASGVVATSPDALTWTLRNSGTTQQLNDVAYGNGRWVAVGAGTLLTSDDGIAWTNAALFDGTTTNLSSVSFVSGHFVVTTNSSAYFTSADGITWVGRTTGANDALNDIALFQGEVVGVGQFGTILTAGAPTVAGGGAISALNGSPVTLKYAVSTSPFPVTYTWTKDGAAYAGPNAPVLRFANVQAADAGVYRVTATNAFGSVESNPYSLALNVTIAISAQPQAQTALVGGTASFSVTATGTPTPTYQWRRNGLDLVGQTGATLTLSNLQLSDTGSITVVVRNASGTVTSEPVALTVNPQAPVIQTPLSAFAVANVAFVYQIGTNATPATFSASGLPAGLTLNAATGVISGTPTQVGTANVSITATNVTNSDTQTLVLTVQPPAPVVTSAASVTARVGTPFSYTITATNSPTSFLAFNLPGGLSLSGATISGTPTTAGFYSAQVAAQNLTGVGLQPLSFQVAAPLNAPVYSGPVNLSGTAGSSFTFTPNFGSGIVSWALGNLPEGGASTLPTGITLNTTTGLISGTTTQSGTFRIALQATSNDGVTTTQVLSFTFNPPASAPLVTSTSSATGTVGAAFSFTITANPTATTFAATGLPGGLTINPTSGLISGVPTDPGISTVSLTVSNLTGSSTTPLTVTINSSPLAPIITNAPVAPGRVGTAFDFTLTASNTPTQFVVTSGALPAGLTLNASTGAITGTPSAAGQVRTWVAASNSAGGRGPAVEMLFDLARSLTVPVITSNGSAAGQVGKPFQYQTVATSSPTSYAVTGTLPSGLAFNPATGVLSGVPSAETTTAVEVTLTATNNDGTSAPKSLAISIAPAPATPRITSALTAGGRSGVAFSYQITASETPTSYSSGELPAGLTLNTTTGALTGTPTVAGTFEISLRAANAAGLGQASTLTLTLAAPLTAPAITSNPTAEAKVGVLFSYQIAATNTPTTYNVTGTLPAGLSLNTATGLLSGNPGDNPGLYLVTLTAANAAGTSQPQQLIIAVAPADNTPVITSAMSATGQVGVAFTYQITATNVPGTTPFPASVFLDAVGLPPGLAVNPSTGLIQGTPNTAGTFTTTLVGINANGTGAMRTLTVTISPAATAPVIGGSLAVNAQAGTSFSYQMVASNNPTSFGALDGPAWLSVNTATGVLGGTPTGPGTFSLRLSARNSGGTSNEAQLLLTVFAAPNTPVVNSTNSATGRVGQDFTYQITATNTPTSYLASGMPPGLSLNGATGAITGTPTTSGIFLVKISGVNANGEGNPVTLTITLSPSLTLAGG